MRGLLVVALCVSLSCDQQVVVRASWADDVSVHVGSCENVGDRVSDLTSVPAGDYAIVATDHDDCCLVTAWGCVERSFPLEGNVDIAPDARFEPRLDDACDVAESCSPGEGEGELGEGEGEREFGEGEGEGEIIGEGEGEIIGEGEGEAIGEGEGEGEGLGDGCVVNSITMKRYEDAPLWVIDGTHASIRYSGGLGDIYPKLFVSSTSDGLRLGLRNGETRIRIDAVPTSPSQQLVVLYIPESLNGNLSALVSLSEPGAYGVDRSTVLNADGSYAGGMLRTFVASNSGFVVVRDAGDHVELVWIADGGEEEVATGLPLINGFGYVSVYVGGLDFPAGDEQLLADITVTRSTYCPPP